MNKDMVDDPELLGTAEMETAELLSFYELMYGQIFQLFRSLH